MCCVLCVGVWCVKMWCVATNHQLAVLRRVGMCANCGDELNVWHLHCSSVLVCGCMVAVVSKPLMCCCTCWCWCSPTLSTRCTTCACCCCCPRTVDHPVCVVATVCCSTVVVCCSIKCISSPLLLNCNC